MKSNAGINRNILTGLRPFLPVIAAMMLPLMLLAAPKKPRSSSDARRQKQQTQQQMRKTSGELTATEKELTSSLRRVSALEAEIDLTQQRKAELQQRLDSIDLCSAAVGDSIAANELELGRLREAYARAVRSSRRNRRELNAMTFIFSSESFTQASRRTRYLREFSDWRKRKAGQIDDIKQVLEEQQSRLDLMKAQTAALHSETEEQERKLVADRASLQTVVGSLKGRQKQLNNLLSNQQKTLSGLDQEIDRLVRQEAEEQRRREEAERKRKEAEERKKQNSKTSQKGGKAQEETKPVDPGFTPAKPVDNTVGGGQFAAQKGKLPSPLSHSYVVAQAFGVQTHRSVKTLQVNNTGIDLESAADATARAVYPGEVTGVFVQPGLNYVVLLRHGQYLTVYANLKSINVKKGDKIKAGDIIGAVAASPVNADRSQLHFEIRREREKFDPALWLRR